MAKKQRKISSKRQKKIFKKKRKKREKQKLQKKAQIQENALHNIFNKHLSLEKKTINAFASVIEKSNDYVLNQFGKFLAEKTGYSDPIFLTEFTKETDILCQLENELFLKFFNLSFFFFENKPKQFKDEINQFQNIKETLKLTLERLLKNDFFLKIDELDDISPVVENIVLDYLDSNQNNISKFSERLIQFKKSYIKKNNKFFDYVKLKEAPVEQDEIFISSLIEQYNPSLDELFENSERFKERFFESLKKEFVYSNRNKKQIKSILTFLTESPKDKIITYFVKKFSTFQRAMDMVYIDLYDAILGKMIDIYKISISDNFLRDLIWYGILSIETDLGDALLVETNLTEKNVLLNSNELVLPSYESLVKIQEVIEGISKSDYQRNFKKIIDFLANEKNFGVFGIFSNLLHLEKNYNIEGLWDFILNKIDSYFYLEYLNMLLENSPGSVNLFESRQFSSLEPPLIFDFLEQKEWVYLDGKTMKDIILSSKHKTWDLMALIKNNFSLRLYLDSTEIENIIKDKELMQNLKKIEDPLRRTLLAKFGSVYFDEIEKLKDSQLIFVYQNIDSETIFKEYLQKGNKDLIIKKKNINSLLDENLISCVDAEYEEQVYSSLSRLQNTVYFDILIKEPHLFKMFCDRCKNAEFSEEIEKLRYKIRGSPYDVLISILDKNKRKKPVKKEIKIISDQITPETRSKLQQQFPEILIRGYDTKTRAKNIFVQESDMIIFDVSHTGHSLYFFVKSLSKKRGAFFLQIESSNYEHLKGLIDKYAYK